MNLYLESDASLTGWGAVHEGLFAGGRWTLSESKHHINYLELLAAFLALQSFVSNKSSIHVRIALGNSTAVTYINLWDVPSLPVSIPLPEAFGSGAWIDVSIFQHNIYLATLMLRQIFYLEIIRTILNGH